MPKPRTNASTGDAKIVKQGHTKDSKGAFGTDPMVRSKFKGESVDLKR